VNGVVPTLLFVLHTVIPIGSVSGLVSAEVPTVTALAATGLHEDAEATAGLSVHTVVAPF
jgi:hypothetical protein